MPLDFTSYFNQYEGLLALADETFQKMKATHPEQVRCRIGCSDCCYALFDLYLVEALYINHHFNRRFTGEERDAFLEKANKIDRRIHQIKRDAFRRHEAGEAAAVLLDEMARRHVRCPLLNADNACALYDVRPITCRFYGIPTAIGGKGYTCGQSAFEMGVSYPTVNLDRIHQKLLSISNALATDIGSKYLRLGELLVPLSMALLTEYDESYLGVSAPHKESTPMPSSE